MSKIKKRERIRAKFDILAFVNIAADKIQNRCNGYNKHYYVGLEYLPREDFKRWALSQGQLFVLFHQWNKNSHQLKFRPTVDRLDSTKGYVEGNMCWVTFSENSRRGGLKGR